MSIRAGQPLTRTHQTTRLQPLFQQSSDAPWTYNSHPLTTSEVLMSRTVSRFVTALVPLVIGFVALTRSPAAQIYLGGTPPAGKWEAQPSPKNGEWPSYNADIRGTRYSPLDQINGTNFNKLEIAW